MIKITLPNVDDFFERIQSNLQQAGIDIQGYPLSHLGLRLSSVEEYYSLRDTLKPYLSSYCENDYNGRPVGKLILSQPITFQGGFSVDHIEAMPPRPDQNYSFGFEHLGVVIGKNLENFARENSHVLSGKQEHGPTPYFIKFPDGTRVKFFTESLEDIVRSEGHLFHQVENA